MAVDLREYAVVEAVVVAEAAAVGVRLVLRMRIVVPAATARVRTPQKALTFTAS